MNIIVADFESFYSQTYSPTILTTEEYIRGGEFEVIGVSVKVNDAPTEWFTGDHEEIKNWLQKFDWADAMLVAHNAMFDAAILSFRFDIHPLIIADTLSMARAIHNIEVGGSLGKLAAHYSLGVKGTEVINALGKHRLDFTTEDLAKYGEYCINDTEMTCKLFRLLADGYPKTELKLIDLTIKMFTEPVLELDALLLEQHLVEVKQRKEDLLAKVVRGSDAKKSIMSNPQFAKLLEEHGVSPPMKKSPTTGKDTFAFAKTDQGLKVLLEHPSLEVQALVAARLGVKSTLEETRTERFLSIAQRGNLPIPLKYFAAHTSRWGGSDKINLQNLPIRGENANTLKRAILAPKGYVLCDSDSSQIEALILAWLSGQDDLVEAFRNKEDVYTIMAARIYDKPQEDISKSERFLGKVITLGCGYGTGPKKLQATLKTAGVDVTYDAATHMVNTYRDTYRAIPVLWAQGDRCLGALIDNQTAPFGKDGVVKLAWGMFHTPLGIPLKYHQLRRATKPNGQTEFVYTSRTGIKGIWGGGLTENIVQHLARVVIGQQMIRVAKKYRVVLTVHDAITCIALKEEAVEAQAYVEECMRWVPPWADGLPLNCESGVGVNYGEC